MSLDLAAAVADGVRHFNRGRYVEAHEVWEALWQEVEEQDRAFLEGLVQLATGLHLRTRRGATAGAEHLLVRALIAFEDYAPARHGVDVAHLIEAFGAYVDEVRAARRPHRWIDGWRIPRIRRVAC